MVRVGGCVGIRQGFQIGIFYVLHVQRSEYVFLKELEQGLASHFLDDQTHGRIIRVAVLPLGTGIEIRGFCAPQAPRR